MPTYIALLRGVNVGGNTLKMERLRELCAELGFADPRTYVQSGNVVFEAKGAPAQWLSGFERALSGETRLPVTIIARSRAQWDTLTGANPFISRKGIDRSKLHVTFLPKAPTAAARNALDGLPRGRDEFHLVGTHIYLHCPDGYGRSKLSNNILEKALRLRATTRNWNTVLTLGRMAAE